MKQFLSVILILAMLLSLAACKSQAPAEEAQPEAQTEAQSDTSERTITGTVSSVDGSGITVSAEDGSITTFMVNDSTTYSIEMAEMPSGGGQQPSGDGSTPPELPSGDGQQPSGDGSTPPELPSGGGQQPSGNGSTPPELPSGGGQQPSGDGSTPPELPSGDGQQPSGDSQQPGGNMQAGLDMIAVGTTITVTINAEGIATKVVIQMEGGFGGEMPGGSNGNTDITYEAVNTYEADTQISGEAFSSTAADENAILVKDGTVSIDASQIDRTSSDSTGGDNASFYGVGAAALTTGGTLNISGSTITTDSAGGAGVFAYGDGTAYVSDTTITTRQNTSGGIHVAGGGTLYAWDLDVETNGESSAAIRSDRGSGTMVVDGGSYTSNGIGSPAIYSTADITVNNASLAATGSEAICIEGKNSIRLYDCELSGNMSDDSRNDCTWNVILYQSMSGDSVEGNSLFEMVGGKLTANNGGMFYTTNTQSTFVLSGVTLVMPEDCDFLLKCTGNSNQRGWGSSGSNGAKCSFTAIAQAMAGDVLWDSISTLDFYLRDGSTLTGAFVQDASNSGDGYACLNVGEDCTWVVTGDSTLTTLNLSGRLVDASGNAVTVVGTDGTVYVSGSGAYTVTVESFSDSADLSGSSTPSSFADFAVDKI